MLTKDKKVMVAGASVGAVAGAIAGVLLAPKAGKETRSDIAKKIEEIKSKIPPELAKAGRVTKEIYSEIVGKIIREYERDKKIAKSEVKEISQKIDDSYEEVTKKIKKNDK